MRKTFLIFLLVGATQYFIDGAIFALLILSVETEFANIVSRLSGACAGYYLNGYFTFGTINRRNALNLQRIAKFTLVWAGLTLLSTLLINTLTDFLAQDDWHYRVLIKLVVEALLVVFSFTLQKMFVFRA